jgi:hypothetical protein
MRVFVPQWTVVNGPALPYKEEVAGSNPASPTSEKRHFAGKTSDMLGGAGQYPAPFDDNLTTTWRLL